MIAKRDWTGLEKLYGAEELRRKGWSEGEFATWLERFVAPHLPADPQPKSSLENDYFGLRRVDRYSSRSGGNTSFFEACVCLTPFMSADFGRKHFYIPRSWQPLAPTKLALIHCFAIEAYPHSEVADLHLRPMVSRYEALRRLEHSLHDSQLVPDKPRISRDSSADALIVGMRSVFKGHWKWFATVDDTLKAESAKPSSESSERTSSLPPADHSGQPGVRGKPQVATRN